MNTDAWDILGHLMAILDIPPNTGVSLYIVSISRDGPDVTYI